MSRGPCIDCGLDTTPHERGGDEDYMVWNDLWIEAGMTLGSPGILCVSCIERRLGRLLDRGDFTHYEINQVDPYDTPRMADRKTRRSTPPPCQMVLGPDGWRVASQADIARRIQQSRFPLGE